MLEKFLLSSYLAFLEFVPDFQIAINAILPFAPLYTYGTTCWSIYKNKSSVGYSIDICATMLISSILRILYYFIMPYEISLLKQSFVMVLIQCMLLRVCLKYRPPNYNPDNLCDSSVILNPLSLLPPVALVPALETDSIWNVAKKLIESYCRRGFIYLSVWGRFILSFFDAVYKRPGLFWQWVSEREYWKFLRTFSAVLAVLTIIFRSSETYGSTLGCIGLFIEALLPLPQIMMIQRLQSVANFKMILLVSWLSGDCFKLSYLFYGTDNVLSIFYVAAFFQMGLNLVILGQYIHYSRTDQSILPFFSRFSDQEAVALLLVKNVQLQ